MPALCGSKGWYLCLHASQLASGSYNLCCMHLYGNARMLPHPPKPHTGVRLATGAALFLCRGLGVCKAVGRTQHTSNTTRHQDRGTLCHSKHRPAGSRYAGGWVRPLPAACAHAFVHVLCVSAAPPMLCTCSVRLMPNPCFARALCVCCPCLQPHCNPKWDCCQRCAHACSLTGCVPPRLKHFL